MKRTAPWKRTTETRTRTLTVCLLLLATLLGMGLGGYAAEPLRVATLPVAPPELAYELGSAYVAKSGTPVAATVCQSFPALEEGLKSGRFDIVFGTCPGSAKKLGEMDLVLPDSDTIPYYYRLAMFLPPGDPSQVMAAEDLDRPGLRIGLCTTHASGPLVDKLTPKATITSSDRELLLDLLEQNRLDVVVALDASGPMHPQLVTIRLPRSIAGDGAAVAGHAFVAKGTSRIEEAKAFLEFLKSPEARKIMVSRALMTEDGSDAKSYSEGAQSKSMPVYRALAKQIAEDYAKGGRNCLDLGCGPGELTVEIAKATGMEVTGLDIEPECMDLAAQYAKDCGIESRIHWVAADVHALPYPDNSFDLVVSRGSIFFWRDQVTALRQVMRVLKPGGCAFIGGGYGRYLSKEDWEKIHPGVDPNRNAAEVFHFPWPLKDVPALMTRAGINEYQHITEGGNWIEFRKPAPPAEAG